MSNATPVFRELILLACAATLVFACALLHAAEAGNKNNQQALINLLVRAGKSEEAATLMRSLYPNGPPLGGELAVEYYDVIGNTDKGWAEAKEAMERLVKADPDDVNYRLGLAKQYARRETTRRRGMQMFSELNNQPYLKDQVLKEWRHALLVSANTLASVPLYQEYLKADPGNRAVQDALASVQHAEAKRLPWQMRKKAELQLAEGHPEEAMATLKKALQLDPQNAWVRFDLSRLYHKLGMQAQGRAVMGQGMAFVPGNTDILYATAMYFSLLDEPENALRLLEKIPAAKRSPAMNSLKQKLAFQIKNPQPTPRTGEASVGAGSQAGKFRDIADAQLAEGNNEEAIATLRKALQLYPTDAWVRFDLSRLYHKQGDQKQGRSLMLEGLIAAPGDDDMLYAEALYVSLLGESKNAWSLLQQIPVERRSPAMQRLHKKLAIQLQTEQALALARSGKHSEMRSTMQLAEADAGNDADMVAIVANAWVDLNDSAHGISLMRTLATQPSATADTNIYFAKLLNRTEQDGELALVLEKLAAAEGLTLEDKDNLRYFKTALAVRKADTLRNAGDFDAAKTVLAPLLKQYPEDTDLLLAQARVHSTAHEPQQARTIYQWILDIPQREIQAKLEKTGELALKFDFAAFEPVNVRVRTALAKALGEEGHQDDAQRQIEIVLANTPADDFDSRMSIADWYIGMENHAAAHAIIKAAKKIAPGNTRVLVQAGRLALAEKHYREAMTAFKQANASDEIADMERRRARGYVASGIDYLNKPGVSPGISNLTKLEIPVEIHMPIGYGGEQAFVSIDPVYANAGALQLADNYDFLRYGKILALDPHMYSRAAASSQDVRGVALAAGYEGDGLRVDIGSTPLGFPVLDIVGGVKWSHYTATSGFSFEISRRPLTGSLLSFAGVSDPVTHETWGGVRSNGASMHISRDSGRLSGFLDLGYYLLTGKNVLDNAELTLRTGFDWNFIRDEDSRLSLGLALNNFSYRDNLRYYSYGHGGYYSPQRYSSIALPFRWTGRKERWSYLLQSSVSTSVSYEKDMPFYPTDAALQAQSISNAAGAAPIYAGGEGRGTGWSLGGALERKITPQLFGGVQLSMDRSDYYTPNTAIFYLRHMFDAHPGAAPYPPDPVKAYSRF